MDCQCPNFSKSIHETVDSTSVKPVWQKEAPMGRVGAGAELARSGGEHVILWPEGCCADQGHSELFMSFREF